MAYTKEQRAIYQRQYLADRMQKLRDLKGGACKDCGSTVDLHFHHRDPSTKEFVVSQRVSFSWAAITAEIEKCDLLCAECHKAKHPPQHGLGMYTHHKCRCDICRAVSSVARKKYKQKAKAKKSLP